MRRVPWNVRLGLVTIVAGFAWLGGWQHWADTRIRVPLNVPISLSTGHLRTPEFQINFESSYGIGIEVDPTKFNLSDRLDCLIGMYECEDTLSIFRVSWQLSRDGQIVRKSGGYLQREGFTTTGARIGRLFDSFSLKRGTYVLDLDVTKDASLLNVAAPHLAISMSWTGEGELAERKEAAFRVCVVVVLTGILVLVVPLVRWYGEKHECGGREILHAVNPPLFHARAGSRGLVFSSASTFGLVGATVFSFVLVPGYTFQWWGAGTSTGLRVRLLGVVQAKAQQVSYFEPLTVRIAGPDGPRRPKLYLNSRQIAWEKFHAELRKELSVRPPDCVVYFKGDRGMEWGTAAQAIDVIRGLHAEVVLVTPRSVTNSIAGPP